MAMNSIFALIATTAALVAPTDTPRTSAANPNQAAAQNCIVSLIDEAQIPAAEAGVLKTIEAREGASVTKGYVLAQIDDTQSQIRRSAALAEKQSAEAQAKDDIGVRFSVAAADVAQADVKMAKDSNAKVPGSVAIAEINQRELAFTKAKLQIEKSQLEQKVAGYTVLAKDAEVQNAENDIMRRKIISPVEGEVVAVLKHVGEWVQPGETVLKLVRLDRLRIEGDLEAKDFDPQQINNRPVKVEVELARGRKLTVDGKIVFVSPLVEVGGRYVVWAEVDNQKEGGQWLLRPGLNAEMTIQLK
jgi:multidrug efflux pump subunit AcrA (membrane-fusion protein)